MILFLGLAMLFGVTSITISALMYLAGEDRIPQELSILSHLLRIFYGFLALFLFGTAAYANIKEQRRLDAENDRMIIDE